MEPQYTIWPSGNFYCIHGNKNLNETFIVLNWIVHFAHNNSSKKVHFIKHYLSIYLSNN